MIRQNNQNSCWVIRFVRPASIERVIADPRSRVKYFNERLSQIVPFFDEKNISINSEQKYTLTLSVQASMQAVNLLREFVADKGLGELDICLNTTIAEADSA